jgi:uncharacterized protein (TIGR02246 family)
MTRDIQDRLDRYVAAFNGGDADAAAEAWADDAKQFPPAAPPAVGREAIREGIKAIQEMSPRLELRSTDVLVEGNVAIETGTWWVKLQTPNGPLEDGGPAVRVWRRGADGVWRLYREIWNSERPLRADRPAGRFAGADRPGVSGSSGALRPAGLVPARRSQYGQRIMERLWSRAVATGGNRSQIGRPRERPK